MKRWTRSPNAARDVIPGCYVDVFRRASPAMHSTSRCGIVEERQERSYNEKRLLV